jgi:hypothetical protein
MPGQSMRYVGILTGIGFSEREAERIVEAVSCSAEGDMSKLQKLSAEEDAIKKIRKYHSHIKKFDELDAQMTLLANEDI